MLEPSNFSRLTLAIKVGGGQQGRGRSIFRAMPKVKVSGQSAQPPDVAFTKIRDLLEKDKDLRKLDGNYQCRFDDKKLTGEAAGSMFKAAMSVQANGAGSQVEIIVDLPFHLALAKGMVEKTLQKKLDESLSS